MRKTIFSPHPLERWLFERELDVRAAFKRVYHGTTFSMRGIAARQASNRTLMLSQDNTATDMTFHASWNSVGSIRKSAACLFEQSRARAWVLGELTSALKYSDVDLFHITFADWRDQRLSDQLQTFSLSTRKRRLVAALNDLRSRYPSMWAVGMLEISGTKTLDGRLCFEPHFHFLISGVPKDVLVSVFKELLAVPLAKHPVQVKSVSTPHGASLALSYFTKFSPEIRTSFLGDDGRWKKGRGNLMKGPDLAEWLAWYAAHRMDQLLIMIGVPPKLMASFRTCELQQVFEKLINVNLNKPPRGDNGSG